MVIGDDYLGTLDLAFLSRLVRFPHSVMAGATSGNEAVLSACFPPPRCWSRSVLFTVSPVGRCAIQRGVVATTGVCRTGERRDFGAERIRKSDNPGTLSAPR